MIGGTLTAGDNSEVVLGVTNFSEIDYMNMYARILNDPEIHGGSIPLIEVVPLIEAQTMYDIYSQMNEANPSIVWHDMDGVNPLPMLPRVDENGVLI